MIRRDFAGLPVVVENPAGSIRHWYDRAGRSKGSTLMHFDYGFIEGHRGSDGDELDCYLGPNEAAREVHVVHQLASPEFKRHDEDKVFLGFESTAAARSAYVSHRNDGDQAIGGMSSMPTEAFKAKLDRRSGAGKIRAERGGSAITMDIVKREDGFHVLSEDHAKHLGGPYASRAEAEKRLAQVEAHKHDRTAKAGRQGQAIKFDSLAAEGKVRTGVWDRICVPGINVKDDEQTEFSAETLSEMARNFAARGDMVMIDWNHQSSYAHENGQPAPALGFYGALAVVFNRTLVACEYARGVAETPPEVATLEDGLWGLRSEVTECGHELLPSFRYVSPTFTPMGTDQQSNPIGYCLLAVAATNTPWQAGTQITFDKGIKMEAEDTLKRALAEAKAKGYGDDGIVEYVKGALVGSGISAGEAQRRAYEAVHGSKMARASMPRDDVGSRTRMMSSTTRGAKIMKNVNAAAKLVGLDGSTDPMTIRRALMQRFEDNMLEEEETKYEGGGFGAKSAAYAKLAKLEEMAQAYEEAAFEEDEGDEPAHVIMRHRMAKLAAKLAGDPPFGGKETPSEEAAEEAAKHAKLEEDDKDAVKHEDEGAKLEDDKDDKKALQAMARKLGLPPTASAARIATAMEARTVGLDKFGALETRLAKMESDKRTEVRTERKRSAEVTFAQAVAHGRTKSEKRDAFIAAYERDPKDAEALLFTPGTFPSADVLMSRMTVGGAPAGQSIREGSSMNALDQRVVTMSALGSSAKALVFGESLAAHVSAMADSDDPRVSARIDRELPEGAKGTKFESFERYMAAERITKKERPDLVLAASEDA